MRYVSSIFLLIFIFCTPDHLVLRSKADYLPLKIDNHWTYVCGSDSLTITVVDDSVINKLDCYIVVFGDEYRYWHHDDDGVREYSETNLGQSGIEYNLDSRYYPLFPFPLVDGNTFVDSFFQTKLIQGDSVYFLHRVSGKVSVDSQDRYQVTVSELVKIQSTQFDSVHTSEATYTLAPNIGIEMFKDEENQIWDLNSYSLR